ncbi:MAG: TatD family hydrolase [Lachnospiraceae bacterium]|nr:TatD family hydrolase [Lachnospiraceae bacterium]
MIFDTHAHYDDHRFDEDRDAVLTGLRARGVGCVVDIGASYGGLGEVLAIAERYPFVYAAVGVHPSEVAELTEAHMDRLRELAAHERVVAVGEIGLDYHYRQEEDPAETDPPREVQKKWFLRQLDLARELDLPVVIHSRDAAKDTLAIMRQAHADGITGVIHCYSGSVETAREYLAMGYFLGIGGVLTFKNGRTLREVVEIAPLTQLVLETDAPYLAPEPHRGKRNDSGYLPLVVRELARIKGVSEEEVIRVTEENARRLYRMEGNGEIA